jgi:photosystem II stability/assembly factor-like uncharacterized protein
MSSLLKLRQSLACVLLCSLFVTGFLTITTRQSHASNNSLPHPMAPGVNEPSEGSGPQAEAVDEAMRARVSEAYGNLAIRFEANRGQFDRQAQFLARGGGYDLFLSSSESVLVLTKPAVNHDRDLRAKSPFPLQAKTIRAEREKRGAKATGRTKGEKAAAPEKAVLRMKLEGTNSEAEAEGLDELPGKTNYFIGNDPRKWQTNIPSYARVMYRDVYPGVDLIYYARQQQLEYDFVIAPGVDPGSIRLNFEGAQGIEVDAEGDLVLRTEAGDVRQRKPVVYQEVDGAKREIPSRYEIKGEQRVGFHVEAYDPSKPLIIDPVLLYSTYLGGSYYDEGVSIAVDAAGNAYVAGLTYSSDFPVVNPVSDTGDVFVSKLNRDGSALIYSTYIGGASVNSPSIAVGTDGCAYITGSTYATDFPTVNAVQATLGGTVDPFAVKLSPDGSALIYSTYLGGSDDEDGSGIAVDADGDAYVTGYTFSKDFPVTNAFQATKTGNQAFRSTNSGGSWSASDSGLSLVHQLFDIAIDPAHPATLYSATNQGVFKSTDRGTTWRLAGTDPDISLASYSNSNLAVDPSDTSIIFVGTDDGLFKSTDGGDTWAETLSGYNESLAIDPVQPSTIYAGAPDPASSGYGALFKSTDGGSNWEAMYIYADFGFQLDVSSVAVNPVNNSILYAGTFSGGIYRSTDSGASWDFLDGLTTDVGTVTDLVINPLNPSIIYASASGLGDYSGSGVYKSTDRGNHWQVVNNGLPSTLTYIHKLAIDPVHPSVLYAASLSGIYKTTDSAAHWSAATTGMTKQLARGIVIDPTATSKVYAVTDNLEDAYVTKLSPSGSTRLYSTFLGGDGTDRGSGIALDSAGAAYLTGLTDSPNFPLENPLPTHSGPIFVTKLDATGASLAYSTRLGGSDGYDQSSGITVDPSGNAYVTGQAQSSDFPVTPGAFQMTPDGVTDAFVTEINAAGSNFVYSTYLGGSGYDVARDIAVNASGQAVVTGQTYSDDFPVAGATQNTFHGDGDAFVTRLNPTGSSLVFSTYLGGSNIEYGNGIAVDSAGNIYVTGYTYSTDLPITGNAFQRELLDLDAAAFITKIGQPQASVRISGSILRNGAGLPEVTVTLKNGAGTVIQTATTPGDGSYSFNAPGGRDYTVTPSKLDYNFVPPSRGYTKVGTDLPMQNFEAVPAVIQISGKVLRNGAGVTGTTLTLTNKAGDVLQTTTTPDDGHYSFNAPGGGDYTVTPSKPSYRFVPTSLTYTKVGADLPMQNFEAFQTIIGIVVQVKGSNGNGLQGVKVLLRGTRTATRSTDPSGFCLFPDLPVVGHYTLTPSRTGTIFTPAVKALNNPTSDQFVIFQQALDVNVEVKGAGGVGIGGITIKVSGDSTISHTTDNQGKYKFALRPGGHYIVTPTKTGVTFNPAFVEINNLIGPVTASFQSFVSITGKVRRTGTTGGIYDVTMTLTGTLSATTTTNGSGIYTFTNLPAGGNYTVTPSKTGYTFNPPSRTFNNLRAIKGLSSSGFDGTP